MTDPLIRMAAREIEERYHEYPKAARAMLAALVRVMAEADFGDETLAAECNDAIAQAEAAGIKAEG